MIPLANPHAQYLTFQSQIDHAIQRALHQPQYILGGVVAEFEAAFAQWQGSAHAIGIGTGTDALLLALRACDIGPGDEVITVSHTAVATVTAIVQANAMPVLVDICADTLTMDPAQLAAAITPKTRAIIPVHIYGHPADMPAILAIARQHHVRVIEDCAQAHGAQLDGQTVGTFGDCACFSFYPTKNLGAIGDGGAITTNDTALADRLRELREYGWRKRYVSHVHGWNSRLDVLQAAILHAKLPQLHTWNARRRAIAAQYDTALAAHTHVTPPSTRADCAPVLHQYVVRTPHRDALAAHCAAAGIGTGIHYPVPVHLQPGYRDRVRTIGALPITTAAASQILSLPMFPELANADVAHIQTTLREFKSTAQ